MTSKTDRLEKLYKVMTQQGYDATAFVPGSNFRYLTGAVHHLLERPLVLFVTQGGQAAVVIPTLEKDHFASHGFDAKLIEWADAEGHDNAFKAAIAQLNLDGKRIGVEGQLMRFFEGEAIRHHAPSAEVVDGHDAISAIRLAKDSSEIEALRTAIQISEEALQKTLDGFKAGMSEREVANILTRNMSTLGGEAVSFGPIVLAGANSAKPHGKVRSDYAIQSGDALLFDFGTTHKGYCADITRTFFVEEASDHQREIYAAVKNANEVGRNAVKVGVAAGSVDEQTTQALKDSGFSDFILHRTGHGLGLDVHEAPYITRGNEELLESGMVFTVEPGLYEAGVVGVRIEDNVVVTEDGCESLTTFTRDLMVVGA